MKTMRGLATFAALLVVSALSAPVRVCMAADVSIGSPSDKVEIWIAIRKEEVLRHLVSGMLNKALSGIRIVELSFCNSTALNEASFAVKFDGESALSGCAQHTGEPGRRAVLTLRDDNAQGVVVEVKNGGKVVHNHTVGREIRLHVGDALDSIFFARLRFFGSVGYLGISTTRPSGIESFGVPTEATRSKVAVLFGRGAGYALLVKCADVGKILARIANSLSVDGKSTKISVYDSACTNDAFYLRATLPDLHLTFAPEWVGGRSGDLPRLSTAAVDADMTSCNGDTKCQVQAAFLSAGVASQVERPVAEGGWIGTPLALRSFGEAPASAGGRKVALSYGTVTSGFEKGLLYMGMWLDSRY